MENINPNPRLVWLVDYAITEISRKVNDRDRYAGWFDWASRWKSGEHQPEGCVAAARCVYATKPDTVAHAMGQVAWGAKEACYSLPQSWWLSLRYVSDAMIVFGIAFPISRDSLALVDDTIVAARMELLEV